jgi:hypothetical protein
MWSHRLIDSIETYDGYILAYIPKEAHFDKMIANKLPTRDFTAEALWNLG